MSLGRIISWSRYLLSHRYAPDLVVVLLARAMITLVVVRAGFVALSDDDFSRAVISQRFALHPSLDPSGSSWLPAPFWWTGSWLRLFGRSWDAVRWIGICTGAGATLLVWVSARMFGLPRETALLGTLLTLSLPYSVWLAAASVPDYPTAVLLLFCAATVVRRCRSPLGWRVRFLGAIAVLIAGWSRYEAWPVALGFAGVTLYDAMWGEKCGPGTSATEAEQRGRWLLGAAALVSLLGPASWLLHGLARHDDALFFVKRVAAYQAALGGNIAPWHQRLLAAPWDLLRFEPELMGACAILTGFAVFLRIRLSDWRRPVGLLTLVLVMLIAGHLRGAGATHHQERSLLVIWMAACLLCADLFVRLLRTSSGVSSLAIIVSIVVWGLTSHTWFRPKSEAWWGATSRRAELGIGAEARRWVGPGERLLIDSADYGFFAVIAAYGDPTRAGPLHDRDPRHRDALDPTASLAALRGACGGADWLIIREEYRDLAAELGEKRAESPPFLLFDLRVGQKR